MWEGKHQIDICLTFGSRYLESFDSRQDPDF